MYLRTQLVDWAREYRWDRQLVSGYNNRPWSIVVIWESDLFYFLSCTPVVKICGKILTTHLAPLEKTVYMIGLDMSRPWTIEETLERWTRVMKSTTEAVAASVAAEAENRDELSTLSTKIYLQASKKDFWLSPAKV